MTRTEAEELAVQALDLAVEGKWPAVLELPLSPEALELVRKKTSLDRQICIAEEQERILYALLIENLSSQQP